MEHTPKTCDDCSLTWDRKSNPKDIVLCPLHQAAPALLSALGGLVSKPAPFCEDKFGGSVCPYCDCREHPNDCEWLVARNLWVDITNRAAILTAKKGGTND